MYFIKESTPRRLRFYYPRGHNAFERINPFNPSLNFGTGWYLAVQSFFQRHQVRLWLPWILQSQSTLFHLIFDNVGLELQFGPSSFLLHKKFPYQEQIMWSANPWFFCADRWCQIIQIRDSLFAKSLQAKCSLTFFRSSATALIHSTQTITFLISETPNCRLIFY